ncbi:tRNA (adenosine(37)-N6)-dimethylallyltransferase MiaA [Erythrobacter sp.]|jgi:tRNA dimethylallyltransferase|uniref:tRNA (adenosine(37)-N6)-dimethylallyltransferase MiaA n=1 Tax=Erythrobacter sp. TaxID=1042 RepID=UPI002EBC1F60|nr:tRNA (adenosine(37)-N6)-dimethylallyltransferase MiaA [Erythrobacter sp.]
MSTDKSPEKASASNTGAPPVALIAGPTASGKSAAALALAEALEKAGRRPVIVNADSMQVYSDIPILSAAPSEEEQDRVPHRLYGAWDGADACSAADWAKAARAEIDAAHEDGAVPILVGGTGLYLKVLIEGIAPIPEIDPEVREVVRAMDRGIAHAALAIEDPLRAATLDPGDSQRIARALEVKRSTGVTLADWQQAKSGGIGEEVDVHAAVLMPERQWIYERCDKRFAQMVAGGAVEEVEALLARSLSPDLPVMRAIGVREIAALIAGDMTKDEAIAEGAQATRRYAKRQFTWLRNQSPPGWRRIETNSIDVEGVFDRLLR